MMTWSYIGSKRPFLLDVWTIYIFFFTPAKCAETQERARKHTGTQPIQMEKKPTQLGREPVQTGRGDVSYIRTLDSQESTNAHHLYIYWWFKVLTVMTVAKVECVNHGLYLIQNLGLDILKY